MLLFFNPVGPFPKGEKNKLKKEGHEKNNMQADRHARAYTHTVLLLPTARTTVLLFWVRCHYRCALSISANLSQISGNLAKGQAKVIVHSFTLRRNSKTDNLSSGYIRLCALLSSLVSEKNKDNNTNRSGTN